MTCTTTNYRVYKHRPLPPLRVAVVAAVAVAVAVALLWREDSNNGAVVTTVLAFAPAVSNFKKRHYNNYDYRYSSYGSTSTRTRTTPPTKPTLCLRVGSDQSSSSSSNGSNSNNRNNRNNDEEDDEDKMISDFFFNVSRCKLNSMRSMDPGIQEMICGGEGSGLAPFEDYNYYQHQPHHHQQLQQQQQQQTVAAAATNHRGTGPATVVVVDWECLLDALPYHVELGIHAARTVWPHLNDLCNFDTDRKWLENKLYAMSHVLGYPDGPDRKKHVACEYALATRLILEEQALDRNESTGTNGKYSRRFHPRSEINGSDKFREEARSRRPLTAGELAVNWREFIRSTLLVKYSRTTTTTSATTTSATTTTTTTTTREPDPEHDHEQQQQQHQRTVIEPTRELERAIEDYLRHSLSSSRSSSRSTGRIVAPRSLPLFAKTKFALRNTSTKLVIRISHRFDHDVAARNINRQLQLAPQERIAKTYKAENAIRRLFLNEDKNMVLLLQPEFDNPKYEYSCSIDDDDATSSSGSGECSGGGECIEQGSGRNSNGNGKNQAPRPTAEESCLRNILRFTHECNERIQSRNNNNNNEAHDEEENDRSAPPSSSSLSLSSSSPPPSTTTTTMPSVVWIDSSWHRLQPLAPIFGDAIPGPNNTNGKKNTALCELPYCDDRERDSNNNNKPSKATASVWLSLYLAEWPAIDSAAYGSEKTKTISTSENHQAAMVYPWTDCLSWDDAEDILLPNDWGLSDTAFQ